MAAINLCLNVGAPPQRFCDQLMGLYQDFLNRKKQGN